MGAESCFKTITRPLQRAKWRTHEPGGWASRDTPTEALGGRGVTGGCRGPSLKELPQGLQEDGQWSAGGAWSLLAALGWWSGPEAL